MFEVSIIMPVYNVKEHLPRAIESALNQKEVLAEIILVDDGSTDGSAEICDAYAKREPLLIKVIHQENRGSGPARNAGLDQARGKHIYFADSDDYFDPHLLTDNCRLIGDQQADMVIFGFTQERVGHPEDRQYQLPNLPQMPDQKTFRQHFRNVYHFSPYALWNKLYSKKFLNRHSIRFTGQPQGQDALFNIEVYRKLASVTVNRKAYYHYVSHDGSAVNRYRPNRYKMELAIAQAFESLITEWDKKEEFNDIIAEEYFHALYLETANLVHRDCPLTREGKIQRLEQLWNAVGREKVLPFKETDINPFRLALLQSYRQNNFRQALLLMKSRNTVAKRYTKTFSRIRSFFKS